MFGMDAGTCAMKKCTYTTGVHIGSTGADAFFCVGGVFKHKRTTIDGDGAF